MTDKEILQGIDRLDAELPFDEICVGGKDNWHDIDVHELLYEVRERIEGWHYPSKGEYPTEEIELLVILKHDEEQIRAIGKYFGNDTWNSYTWDYSTFDTPIAWQYIIPPKEEA